ncbi:MAG: hypothetical protein KAH86_07355, partial [Methanosarcinales archaeon]|nr:hypothetical protein [Methanosarcinales archaeon]
YCNYCHNNATGRFNTTMQNAAYNATVANHSTNYAGSNPNCIDCHNTTNATGVKLHGESLEEKTVSASLCLECHGVGNFTWMRTTAERDMHNGTVCLDCHLGDSSDIHPVKYLLFNNTTTTSNTTGAEVNCTSCHQSGTVNARFTDGFGYDRAVLPKIDPIFLHSQSRVYNATVPSDTHFQGWIWGEYWDDADHEANDGAPVDVFGIEPNITIDIDPETPGLQTTPNEDNANPACMFCHGDTKHANPSLGNVGNTSQTVNQDISSSSYWCSNCHYDNSTFSASGYEYTNMTNQLSVIPPKIDNYTWAQNVNRTYNTTLYYNHTVANLGGRYDDEICRSCHGSYVSGSLVALSDFVHQTAKGFEGHANCTYCHASSGAIGYAPYTVNITAFEQSIHSGLNSGAVINNSTAPVNVTVINKACWGCHSTNGTQPIGHPDKKTNPWLCVDCHVPATGLHNATWWDNRTAFGVNATLSDGTSPLPHNVSTHYFDNATYFDANLTAGNVTDAEITSNAGAPVTSMWSDE